MNDEASFLKDPTVVFMTELLGDVKKGAIQLPRFQRRSVWTGDQRIELLDSVRRGIPIGAIMVWRTNAPVAARRWFGPHYIAEGATHGPHQYVLDGGQRIATLLGALFEQATSSPTDDDDAPKEDDLFEFFYDLRDERFVRRKNSQEPPAHWLPLPDTLQTVPLLRFQRKLVGPDAEVLVARADALATRFRAYKIPVIILASDDIEFATTTFRRVNSNTTPMSDLDMISALVWTPSFDLEKLLREERDHLDPPQWQIDDETWLRCLKATLGLDLYADTGSVQRALTASPGAVSRTREAINLVADFFSKYCNIEFPELVPYGHQIPLLVQAFSGEAPLGKDIKLRLAAWFWLTTYAGVFAGISGGGISRLQSGIEELARGGPLHWPRKIPFKREPLPQRFDLRYARARALATLLARDHESGPFDLGLYGSQALIQLVTTNKERESPGNRFFAPLQQRNHLASDFSASESTRALHHVSSAAWEAFVRGDHAAFVRTRAADLDALEEADARRWARYLEEGATIPLL